VAKDDRDAEKKSCVTRLERTACGVLGKVNESERVEHVSDRQLALNLDYAQNSRAKAKRQRKLVLWPGFAN
jgi:hypothetical protein